MYKFHRFFCLLILPIVITSFSCPPSAFALRVLQDEEGSQSVRRAGMEEFALEPFEDSVLSNGVDRSQIQSLLDQFGEYVSPSPKVEFLGPEARDSRYSFVARRVSDRKIVGLAVAGPRHGRSPSTLYLDWILVDQAFRRQGLGDRLMQAVSDAGTAARFHLLFWGTPVKNEPSQAFYDRLPGAERVGEVDVGLDRYVQYEKPLFRESTGLILAPPPDPRWEPFTFSPESAAEILERGVGYGPLQQIRKLHRGEKLLVPGLSRATDAYISTDGRVLFFRMGDTLTIQMENPGKRSRLLIQEGTVWSADRKRERRLEISVEKKGTRRVLFAESSPEAGLSLIRGLSYWGTKEGTEMALVVDRRVGRVTPGARWDRTLFSASTLIENGSSEEEDVRVSLRSEEEAAPLETGSPIRWAGDLPPVTQVIEGQTRPAEVSMHLWAPTVPDKKFLDLLELEWVVEGEPKPFPLGRDLVRLDPDKHGPGGENFKVWVTLPEQARDLLAQKGHLRYRFRYRLKGDLDWEETTLLRHPHNPSGELIYHPDWLFRRGMTTINAKAWGSFDAIRRRLTELEEAGVKVIVLQGIHPGHSAFEIDNYEIADPNLGGDEALDRLLQEGKERGFRFIMPWVPGHASDQNHWIAEDPRLFYQVKEPGEFLETKTILVNLLGRPVRFLRGNVFPGNKDLPEGDVHSAEVQEGFGPTVAFNLWSKIARDRLAPRWEQILGKWADRGISGFYTDTTHSIEQVLASVGDPDWLEGIKRRVRAKNPGVIFGDEALWGKDGPFINERGASFAQPYWPYIELLLDFVKGGKQPADLAGKFAEVEEKAPGMLQRVVTFLQNHDEEVEPAAFYVEQDLRGKKEEFLGVLAVLQILGLPGIPSLEIGQINGDPEKRLVTGHTKKYDKQWNYGYHPEAPAPDRYDPFADQSERAQRLRGLHSQLFRLRADNTAFWLPEEIRYPTASAHVFVSYRSAGNRRAVVVLSVNRSASDPRADVAVELDKLNLPEKELKALAEALEKPSLVWPAPADTEPLQGRVEQNLLMLKMPPVGVVVLEFEVAAAGVEQEAVFPAPVRMDRPAVLDYIWADGGNVYPSIRGQLGTVAFVSPEDGEAGVEIYASLWNLNQMVPDLFRLPGIPPWGAVYLHDERGIVPRGTFQRVREILKEKGLKVMARISANGSSWEVEMEPIDAGGGLIRFKGWVPARQEFIGDYRVAVGILWDKRWHRLKEEGWFRIHPLQSNGSKLRLPPGAKKYKLWVSPTGQPVVIGWTPPQANLGETLHGRVPVADQPYWIRFWGGRFYLFNRAQMDKFEFPYNLDQPDVRPGERIVEAAIDVDPSGGIVDISSAQVFEDQDGTLTARLKKSFEVLGIRWPLQDLPPVDQKETDSWVQRMSEQLEKAEDVVSFQEFLARVEEETGWGRVAGILSRVSPEKRDDFLHSIHRKFAQWAQTDEGEFPRRSFEADGNPIIAFSLNGVEDLTLRRREGQPARPFEGNLFEGGGPLAVARAAANLRVGGEVGVVALGLGDSGERLFDGLKRKGFYEEPGDLDLTPAPKEGLRTRVSVNGAISSSPVLSAAQVQRAADIVVQKMDAYGEKTGTLVIGEHLVRVDDAEEEPLRIAKILSSLVREAKKRGWQVAVAASSSWDKKTFGEILAAQPDTFHLDLESFARLVSSKPDEFTEEGLLYRPKEEVAELAEKIRIRYGVERLIVSLKTAGEILVTPSGWFTAIPSPALELTYVTGERDIVLGIFLRLLQMGIPVGEALNQAVIGGVLHMEGWGRPVTGKEIEANSHRASPYKLLQPGIGSKDSSAKPAPIPAPAYLPVAMVLLKTEPKKPNLRTFIVAEDPAARFARAARRDSPVRVVIGPSAFQVEGMATVLEMLAGTSLRDRLEVLPSERVSYPQRVSEMIALVRRLRAVRNVFVVGHAADADPIMDEFVDFISSSGEKPGEERLFSFPFERQGLKALQGMVRQLLLDLGVPEGIATEEAVTDFLAAAGMEQNA